MKSDYRFRDLDAVDLSNHSRVSDVVPSPENVSQSEIEQLRAINAQLVAALRGTRRWDLSDGPCWCDLKREKAGVNKLHMRGCDAARAALALNAAEKESNK
jgi:hypothetical protein